MADWEYYTVQVDKNRGSTILDALRNSDNATKAVAIDYLIDTGMLHSDTIADSAFVNAMGDSLGITTEYEDFDAETHNHTPHDYYTPTGPSDSPDVSGYMSHDDRMDINQFMSEEGNAPIQDPMEFGEMANWTPLDGSEGLKRKRAEGVFSAEYTGPSTLSSALSGARKTGKNGKHLTIIQRLVAKYGIEKGSKIYKHFGIKQKRASPKVRGKVRGTKSGPRRYSEGRVGGAGRSQVYQKGDRTGSWTPSGGHTTRFANSGKAWYQERGLGTPVAGPIPDTELAGKAMGQKRRGMFVNPAGIVGYPFVPAQQRERKSRK